MTTTESRAASSDTSAPPLATDTAANKAIAYAANHQMLVEHDITGSIENYWGDYYLQHNSRLRNGMKDFKIYKYGNVLNTTTEIVRVIGDRDLVFQQLRVSGLMPQDLYFFDVYRIEAGKIVEHWDGFQETDGEPNPSGRTIFDGPTEIEHPELTEATRAVVTGLVSRVFVYEDYDVLDEYIAPDMEEYSPGLTDGLEGLRKGILQAQWYTGEIKYFALRRVIAEGEYAVTMSQGEIAGVPYALWDLWRVLDGKVVGHWSCRAPARKSAHHDNPAV